MYNWWLFFVNYQWLMVAVIHLQPMVGESEIEKAAFARRLNEAMDDHDIKNDNQ